MRKFCIFNLVAKNTYLFRKKTTLDLIKKYFPQVKIRKKYFSTRKFASLIDTEKVRKELGFKEEFPIRRYLKWIKTKDKRNYYEL